LRGEVWYWNKWDYTIQSKRKNRFESLETIRLYSKGLRNDQPLTSWRNFVILLDENGSIFKSYLPQWEDKVDFEKLLWVM